LYFKGRKRGEIEAKKYFNRIGDENVRIDKRDIKYL